MNLNHLSSKSNIDQEKKKPHDDDKPIIFRTGGTHHYIEDEEVEKEYNRLVKYYKEIYTLDNIDFLYDYVSDHVIKLHNLYIEFKRLLDENWKLKYERGDYNK